MDSSSGLLRIFPRNRSWRCITVVMIGLLCTPDKTLFALKIKQKIPFLSHSSNDHDDIMKLINSGDVN